MSTINRITGLATGMDTDSIVQQLMEAERTSVDELEKEKTTIEWQREALLDVNSKMLAFRNEALNMKMQGTYKSYTATSSNPSIVSTTTTTDAQEGVYKVTVKQLATQTTLTGQKAEQTIVGGKINFEDADFSGKEFSVTYNGETKTIKFGDEGDLTGVAQRNVASTFQTLLQKKIDNEFGTSQIQVSAANTRDRKGFSVSFSSSTSLNLPITLAESSADSDALGIMGISDGASTAFNTSQTLGEFLAGTSDAFTNDELTINVNGKDFTFNKNETLSTVFSELNKDSDIDINIRYSNAQERIIINRDSYGEGKTLTLSGSEAFWNELGIRINDSAFMSQNMVDGKNAIFDMSAPDGETAEDIRVSSNNFTYGGISMTFLEAKEGETVSLTVSKNVDEIYSKIEGFVNSYNELLGTLNKYYKEEKSGYEPLTDEERESLSEKQEEQWEEKAKQGILRRDSTLQSAISSMRSAVTSMVSNSSISSLFAVGISTSSYDSVNTENNGKLVIDEEKLQQAIKDDIDGVAGLFSNAASMIQSSKIDKANFTEDSLKGKAFSVTYGGASVTVTFDRGFDLSTTSGAGEFEDYLKEIFDNKFGSGAISVTYSNGRILFNSSKGTDLQLNSVEGNDALSLMGIKDGAKYDSSEKGFAVKLYDICTNTMNSIIDKAGSVANIADSSTLGQALKRKNEAISKMEDRLEALEERYYNQFAAMEEAISEMNSQSESLTNMLSGS